MGNPSVLDDDVDDAAPAVAGLDVFEAGAFVGVDWRFGAACGAFSNAVSAAIRG